MYNLGLGLSILDSPCHMSPPGSLIPAFGSSGPRHRIQGLPVGKIQHSRVCTSTLRAPVPIPQLRHALEQQQFFEDWSCAQAASMAEQLRQRFKRNRNHEAYVSRAWRHLILSSGKRTNLLGSTKKLVSVPESESMLTKALIREYLSAIQELTLSVLASFSP